MIVRKTKPEEKQRTDELFSIAFDTPLEPAPSEPESDRFHHWAAFDGDEMMSTFTVTDFEINFDGHSCKMGGIGGVATLPQYRRRGGIRGCFEAALPDMYENGFDFSYLYPFSTAYYRKFGYECCVQKYRWTVHIGQLNPPAVNGSFRLAEKNHPMTDAIRAIDLVWESKFNMMVRHAEADYGWTKKCDPAAKQEFTYVYFDASGAPKSYTTFKLAAESEGRNLICSRLVFLDKEGFAGLMHLFKSMASDHMYAKFTTPALPAMQYLMPEWSLGAAQWSIQSAGMARVINVEHVLKKANYGGSGTISLKIHDPQISRNNDVFTVTFSDGQAVSVTPGQAEPDAVLTIPTFSALISGVWDFADMKDSIPGLEIKNETACFEKVFYRKKLMITDYF